MPRLAGEDIDLTYEDRPELLETFADNVQRMSFDGRTLRIEFCVARLDDPIPAKGSKPARRVGKSRPVCRLVLDLDGAVDLFNKINTLQAAMERQGVIQTGRKDT
ncbi:hypothetical protein QO010_002507 [Caulobacter ginsengisoli]|uniref:Uncharacterized protein n=1 Tax=Caulobacter ginsengisoli TaxID=400775 RepID=A0ABU0IRT8_9CAUL|nr:hypothetical protein [Caulobacter ginsengisoli]MDQ0464723.1 hypothetical protein [Caulobacter ginsengisoli]